MKKKKPVIMIAAVFLIIVMWGLFYTRPMTLSQIGEGVDFSQCESVYGYYADDPDMEMDIRFEINKEEPYFLQVVELFEKKKFHRSVISLLPEKPKYHRWEEKDYKWEVIFCMKDQALADHDGTFYKNIRISNFFGKLTVYYEGRHWSCFTEHQEEWMKTVMDMILENRNYAADT